MPHYYERIYAHHADFYNRLVSREDFRGNLLAALLDIQPFDGLICADLGAGTGRTTRLLSLMAQHVYAFDAHHAMLQVANRELEQTGMVNWSLTVADNRHIPLPDDSVHLAVEGWRFAHQVDWSPQTWRDDINYMLLEMHRIVKPGGTLILLETMGIGNKQPDPPKDALAELYAWWQDEHNFAYRWIRTDYQFESVQEAEDLLRFGFGDTIAAQVVAKQQTIVPQSTGIWWKQI